MAQRARGFNMRVLYYDRQRHPGAEEELGVAYQPLDDLLRLSDFVSLHVDLNEETQGLIGPRELALMKATAVLINTARGPVVNAEALYEALQGRQIGYAALDVTDPEPIPPGDKLLSLDNIIVVPHIASATVSTRTKMCMMAVDNLLAGLKGEPLPFAVN